MSGDKKMKLIGKFFIKGEIKALTGLHIGGSKTALDIGGIDLNVIKTAAGVPYIPGSSLKGKLRAMLAREEGSKELQTDSDTIKEIFGESPTKENPEGRITRLIVRDAFLYIDHFEKEKENGEFTELELDYTEGKWENTINRKTGTAGNPRQIERVPAGAIFKFELIYDIYDDVLKDHSDELNLSTIENLKHIKEIKKAMRLLEDDYLGGSGSRGYGKIEFLNVKKGIKTIKDYENDNKLESKTMEL